MPIDEPQASLEKAYTHIYIYIYTRVSCVKVLKRLELNMLT